MSKLPPIKSKDLVKIFQKQGFCISRQTGSHGRLIHPDGRKITIAIHDKEIPKGTLSAILRQAEISREKFLALLKKKK
jgi:predicted RNA binding protein YcfA (HicA-like mRNA interferase family)